MRRVVRLKAQPNKSFEPTASQRVFYPQDSNACGLECAAAQFGRYAAVF